MTSTTSRALLRAVRAGFPLLLLGAPVAAALAQASASPRLPARAGVFAGLEVERYLRSLQVAGVASAYPWSLRGFAPGDVDSLLPRTDGHPWAARYDLTRGDSAAERRARRGLGLLRPSIAFRHNSAFPFGSNDGAVWAGRGLTTVVQAGVSGRWGPVSLTLAPLLFRAENRAVALRENGMTGALRFAHGVYPVNVDLPQRFGDAPYQRLDPGQSTLRVDLVGVAAGASTANAWWGPADQYPFLLGNNAAGFPHLFVGTQRPVPVGIGHVHARVLWGQLAQSEHFDPATDPIQVTRARRFAAGLIGVFQPRGLPGLELGAARFFHARWPERGMPGRYLTRPFEGILKKGLDAPPAHIPTDHQSQDGENQLAALFGRWAFPRSGVEVYFELGRDDHNWDARDLLLEPDHQASVLLGLRKTWRRSDRRLAVLRLESLNHEINPPGVNRAGGTIYAHASGANQGHTQRGQLLGAATGVGSGAGSIAAVDWYRPDGRWTVSWTRVLRGRWDATAPGGGPNERAMDVIHSVGVERLLFTGAWDLMAGVTGSYNFNRDFAADRRNLSLQLSVAGLPW